MDESSKKPWVLITGASSGIGEVFARRFAREGWNTVLVARSLDKLNTLARFLESESKVSTLVIGTDLTGREAPRYVYDQTKRAGIEIEGLVNNAGFGASGKFQDVELERYLGMIDLNVRALVELTHLFLKGMPAKDRQIPRSGFSPPFRVARDEGLQIPRPFILNVSSTACFQPIDYSSVYAATKAFVTLFSEALWMELKSSGIRVLNVCPGLTKTNFGNAAGGRDYRKEAIAELPEAVVETAFRALKGNRPTVISGWGNRALIFLERLIPHRALLWLIPHVQRARKDI